MMYAYNTRISPKGYARVLYENYRARMIQAGHPIPKWEEASPVVQREFVEEAKQLMY